MSKTIRKSAKTVQEAINLALAELRLSEDEVTTTVIEEGSKGLFGFGVKDAVVEVTSNVNPQARAEAFLSDVFLAMGMRVNIDITCTDKIMNINLSGDGMGLIIGKHGDTLNALEHLVSLTVNRGDGDYVKVVLDTENYREKRRQTLVRLAENLAGSVVAGKKKITLEPMSANERRIIHSTLQSNPDVDTYSIGEEPYRKLVIALKKKQA
ncbi:MAG: protein jag [Ruminococcaceae bacterium]|nr:protein jag [Oscillospiraceae bacterium]